MDLPRLSSDLSSEDVVIDGNLKDEPDEDEKDDRNAVSVLTIDNEDHFDDNNNVKQSIGDKKSGKVSREPFRRATKSAAELRKIKSKSHRNFYKHQNELVKAFLMLDRELQGVDEDSGGEEPKTIDQADRRAKALEESRKTKIAIYASFIVNICLFCLKVYAAIASGSFSVIASALDSFLDLLSGSIIFITNYFMNKKNIYKYPAGKSRLEPLGIIVFASCMFTATIQLITSSVEALVTNSNTIDLTVGPLVVIGATLVSKTFLFLYCRLVKGSPSVAALAQDHRNDILSNGFGAATALIGNYFFWRVDPIGAIIIGFYIMNNWFRTGFEQVKNLTGKSASSAFLTKLTYLALHHDKRILQIDTVRAFHLGVGFLVEVDIVLPEDMSLKESHDIGESLQIKLEQISNVDRAFVHLDYETQHQPEHNVTKLVDLESDV